MGMSPASRWVAMSSRIVEIGRDCGGVTALTEAHDGHDREDVARRIICPHSNFVTYKYLKTPESSRDFEIQFQAVNLLTALAMTYIFKKSH